ncbi:MAG: hypothetical protein H7A38_03600 [Chlamydiales bacterium]|nr:hypothetical protein [Chlamydiales bacterium]
MSLISRITPAQTQNILTGANFCHRALGISRTITKWIAPLSLLSFGYHVYQYKALHDSHTKERHRKRIEYCTECSESLNSHGKRAAIFVGCFLFTSFLYLTSVGMQFLNGKLIEHLEARGQ